MVSDVGKATHSDLEGFALRWQDAGLPEKQIKPLLDALTRHAEIGRDYRATQERGTVKALGVEVAEGKLSYLDGLEELARRLRGQQKMPASALTMGPTFRDVAQGECRRAARDFLRANAQKLVGTGGPSFVSWFQRYVDPEVR